MEVMSEASEADDQADSLKDLTKTSSIASSNKNESDLLSSVAKSHHSNSSSAPDLMQKSSSAKRDEVEGMGKSREGVFWPKAPDVEKLTLSKDVLEIESDIKASIVHFDKVLDEGSYYFVRGIPTIKQLVYESTPAQYMASRESDFAETQDQDSKPANHDLRWIHLPGNNMAWVENVVQRIYNEASPEPVSKLSLQNSGKKERRVRFDVVDRIGNVVSNASDESIRASLLLRPPLWSRRQYQNTVGQRSAQGRFLKSLYSRISTDPQILDDREGELSNPNFRRDLLILMPYIHWETIDQYLLRNKCLDWMAWRGPPETNPAPRTAWKQKMLLPNANEQVESQVALKNRLVDPTVQWNRQHMTDMMRDLRKDPSRKGISIDAQLLLAYVHERCPLHVRRTLDQSFYHTLPDTDIRERDLDQVLYRHTKRDLDMKQKSRILMVDQLWLWVIDEPGLMKTVLTAFPPRWRGDPGVAEWDVSDVYHKIFSALQLGEPQITSLADLVSLIIDKCTGLFHPSVTEVDSLVDYLEVFAVDIGRLADAQTKLANSLSMHSYRLVKLERRRDYLFNAPLRERWLGLFKNSQKEITPPLLSSEAKQKQESTGEPEEKYNAATRNQQETAVSKNRIQPPAPHASPEKLEATVSISGLGTERKEQHETTASKDESGVLAPHRISQKPQAAATTSSPKFSREDKREYHSKEWFADTTEKDLVPGNQLTDLSHVLNRGTKLDVERAIEHEMDMLVDVTAESECFKEIKDILDELNSISHVFHEEIRIISEVVDDHAAPKTLRKAIFQESVSEDKLGRPLQGIEEDAGEKGKVKSADYDHTSQAAAAERKRIEESGYKYDQVLSILNRRKLDIESLNMEANRVYKAICDLLDLKQKQASVSEAYFARQEAKETAQQGKTLMVFTVITITFLPLSFIAAIYSMNAKEINGNERPISHVWKVMFPTTLGVLVVSLLFAFNNYIIWFFVGLLTWTWKLKPKAEKPGSSGQTLPDSVEKSKRSRSNTDRNSNVKSQDDSESSSEKGGLPSVIAGALKPRKRRSKAGPEAEDVEAMAAENMAQHT